MTKIRIYFILFVLMFSMRSVAQQSATTAAAQIRFVMAKQEQAWNQNDLLGFLDGYWKSDSLKFIGKNGIQFGWQKTLDNYRKSYPDQKAMGNLTFNILQVDVLSEDDAFVVGEWRLDREGDILKGFYTLLWKKMNGRWVIVCDHSS